MRNFQPLVSYYNRILRERRGREKKQEEKIILPKTLSLLLIFTILLFPKISVPETAIVAHIFAIGVGFRLCIQNKSDEKSEIDLVGPPHFFFEMGDPFSLVQLRHLEGYRNSWWVVCNVISGEYELPSYSSSIVFYNDFYMISEYSISRWNVVLNNGNLLQPSPSLVSSEHARPIDFRTNDDTEVEIYVCSTGWGVSTSGYDLILCLIILVLHPLVTAAVNIFQI